jgi:REP element-mobilizing transposase RayT
MSKKLTIEFVKDQFEEHDFELLETEYINNHVKMRCICKVHGEFSITYAELRNGHGCRKCSDNRRKLTYEFVKVKFKERGYNLLETEYINSQTLMHYLCKIHEEEFSITYGNLNGGYGCPKCGRERANDSEKLTYEFVDSQFKAKGYQLIDTKYIGSGNLLRYNCSSHGEQKISYDDLKQGVGCRYCSIDRKKIPFEIVQKTFNAKGYTLLDTKYKNCYTPLNYLCPKHGIQQVTYTNLTHGSGCPICLHENSNIIYGKGGISPLSNYLRNHIYQWKFESMKSCGFKCVITGKKFDNIHHLYGFNTILQEVLNETNIKLYSQILDYTEEELETLTNRVIAKHYEYPLGACLTKEIHDIFHSIYGKGDNTPEQFYEFSKDYLCERTTNEH